MKYLIPLFLFLPFLAQTQNPSFDQKLFDDFEIYREQSLTKLRFKHNDIQPLIEQISNKQGFEVRKLGESIEGRNISLISVGRGDIDILLWSQMHGNEPTATMAIFDILNFLADNEAYADEKTELLDNERQRRNTDGAAVIEDDRRYFRLHVFTQKVPPLDRRVAGRDEGLHGTGRIDHRRRYPFDSPVEQLPFDRNAPRQALDRVGHNDAEDCRGKVERFRALDQLKPGERYVEEFGPRGGGYRRGTVQFQRIALGEKGPRSVFDARLFIGGDRGAAPEPEIGPFPQVADAEQHLVAYLAGLDIEERHHRRFVMALQVGVFELRVPRIVPVERNLRGRAEIAKIDHRHRLVIGDEADGELGPSLVVERRDDGERLGLDLERIAELRV